MRALYYPEPNLLVQRLESRIALFQGNFLAPHGEQFLFLLHLNALFFFFLDFMPVDLVYNFKAFASNLQIIELH